MGDYVPRDNLVSSRGREEKDGCVETRSQGQTDDDICL
jgi:hypothetical protein